MANNSIKILVIDDLQDNLITLNALIKDAFPEALTLNALSGEEGINIAMKEDPDVILLDILMPGMDGYEVCQKLKADEELCDIPVVFVTAIENTKEALLKALDCGGEAFLTKPIDEIELTAQIQSMLKIREGNKAKKDEKARLEKLVEERSKKLLQELDARKQAEKKLKESEATVRKKLKAILKPEGDYLPLELSDIIDTKMLHSLMDDFYQLTGMLGAVIDVSGKVLVAVGWQNICTKFHRCHQDTLKNCIESDTVLTSGVAEGEFKPYRCKNNLWDIVTPIMIGGKHLGNVFMGQCFLEGEEPDIEVFREQAKKYGFDEQEYLAALDQVPRFSQETVEKGMHFYSKLAKIISTLSYSSIQQSRMLVQQKQAEEELNFKAKLLNSVGQAVIATNPDGIIKYLNPAAENLYGWSAEEALEKNIMEVTVPEMSVQQANQIMDRLGHGAHWSGEFKVQNKAGIQFPAFVNDVPVYNTDGVLEYIIGMSVDISERKRVEDALKESEEQFKTIVENGSVLLTLTDSQGRIEFASPQCESVIGWKVEDIIGVNTPDFIHPEDRQMVTEERAKVTSIQPIKELEYRIYDKEHNVRWISHSAAIIRKGDATSILSTITNITDRMEAEEANKELLKRFEIIGLHLPGVIYQFRRRTDGSFHFPYASHGISMIYGVTPEEVEYDATNAFKAIHPDDLERVSSTINHSAETLKPWHDVYRVNRPSGKVIWVEGSSTPIKLEDGSVIWHGFIQDITERKKSEIELFKLSTAVHQSPSVIAITDTKGRLEYVNPQFVKSTGYSMEEAIGQNPSVLKSGVQSDDLYKELWDTISAGNTWRGEFNNKKKNGELFWEIASVSPILDEQGNIVNYIKVAEDITKRKQAEENFRHSIDESPLGIRIVSQQGKAIYVNKALLDIYEFSSTEEFFETKAVETYTEKSYQEHLERKELRKKGIDTNDYEISIRRKNGDVRHIKVWRKEVIWNKKMHFQVINQDITEVKQLNTDLYLAKEKAEESNRLKTAFLNNMSHEIRTPLNGITGFISLLQNSGIADEQKKHYFDIINKSSDRLITTVTDIMDISRIEAGEVKVTKSEVSVNDVLEEQYCFFKPQTQSKGLNLIYKPCPASKTAHFVTDKHKLEGILTNLIKNAIKFTEQGDITLSCSLKTEHGIEMLEFYIKDTGIGIPKSRLGAIFNRFEQADIEDSRVHQGSGLGLAIAKSYVEMLGGEISVSSEVGLGSIFAFKLPYAKQLDVQIDSQRNANCEMAIGLSHLSVIIAEDDEASMMYFDAIFEDEFKSISYTQSGDDTVDKCRENPETDLILMDIKMPGMNGYDATREIRKFNSDVIIIAQTAFGLSGDREKAMDAGCNDYISKPIKKEQLEFLIKKHINNQTH